MKILFSFVKYLIHTGVYKIDFSMWLFYIDYLFLELPENYIYHNKACYQDIKLPVLG